jgi:hypothetical protein
LRKRYDARSFGIGQAIKYVGIAGGLLAFFGLLGLVGALAGSEGFGAALLLLVGGGMTAAGIWLSVDKLARYTGSSKVVVALGITAATSGIGVALHASGASTETTILLTGFAALLPVGYLSYRFGNTFLLCIGLLGLFHWVGSWTSMLGRSTYSVSVQDPRVMSAAALAIVCVGVLHELRLRDRTGRFFQAYEALGLVYLDLSLLIMTIGHGEDWGPAPLWMVLLAVAAVAEIVVGARLHNGVFTGFGVTFFAINVYTRFFERFWDSMDVGVFFLVGGLSLFGAGVGCELLLKRLRGRPS